MGGGRSLGGSDGFGCKVDWWCGAEAHAQHAAAFDVPNTPNNSHSKRQATIHTVFFARCSAKFHDKSCNSLKPDIYYISSVWQIEGGKPFYISKTSGKACRAGMWNSVGFVIRVV